MTFSGVNLGELIGAFLGFFFTVAIFSYILGDNFLFRITISIFIGVAAGYAAIVAVYNVIWPQLIFPLFFGSQSEKILATIPFILGVFLIFKVIPRYSSLGNPVMAYLVGVGAAVIISGAVMGTIFPQVSASINTLNWKSYQAQSATPVWNFIQGALILISTITTMVYFQFFTGFKDFRLDKRSAIFSGIVWIGKIIVAVTFGAIFAGVLIAFITALVERMQFIIDFIIPLFITG
ncbi:MAG: hypothetical protein JW908_04170 [Anaerolineales bacterium]|nr:hypothetical protein [Anaerolineales bacterium]